MSTTDPKQLQPDDVEVGVDTMDTKSDAGSATTAPSVESGDAEGTTAAAVPAKSRRNNKTTMMIGGATLLIVVGIIVAVVSTSSCDKNKKNKSTATTAITAEESIVSVEGEDQAPPMYPEDAHKPPASVMFAPPFGDVTLPTFQEDVLETYNSVEALQNDLTTAVKAMLNKVILQNMAYYSYSHSEEEGMVEELAMSAGIGASAASAAGKQASQQKVLNSLTNNQERDVDEADVLKNDDTYVYAAYGDYLVVWDKQGNLVTQEKMPVPEAPQEVEGTPDDYYFAGDHPSMMYAYIESIQLTQNHILVIVGGLGEYTSRDIAYGNTGTHLRIYNKPTASSGEALELVATRDIQGYYFHSRYLEETDSIHIVTGGDFSTFTALVEPLDVYHFDGLDETQYYNKAKTMAEEELIPAFVQKMTDFFVEGNKGQLPSILKVNNWLTQAQQDAKIAKEQELMDSTTTVHAEEHFYGSYDDAFRAYMLVTSLAATDLPTTAGEELELSTTAIMGPSSYGSMYAKGDSIILTVDRYEWDAETNQSEETLFLIHLKDSSNGRATPTPYGITHMPGYLPNIRSIDIQGDDLRVATTYQKWMPLENVWPVCGDSWYFEDSCMTESNWNECFDAALNCRNVVKKGCPYEFECADDPTDPETESSTENFVTVFDINTPGQMVQRGSVAIGEAHEIIMGVHFGETFSYANTFDQRDPFYVLNLPAGQAPTIAGEIKLEGFSSYLQPLNDDASIVLGIGQNVTGEGMDQGPNGLLVTVFDVSNTAAPKVLASEMLVNPKEQDSYSDAEWDAKSVQYNDGILVIPVSFMQKYSDDHDDMIWDGQDPVNAVIPPEPVAAVESTTTANFEGYLVLDVSDVASQGIKEVARIDHNLRKQQTAGSMEHCEYCSGYVSYRRSFLFEDNSLMTVHDSAVMSTDLTTGDRLWSFNVTMDGEERNCCY